MPLPKLRWPPCVSYLIKVREGRSPEENLWCVPGAMQSESDSLWWLGTWSRWKEQIGLKTQAATKDPTIRCSGTLSLILCMKDILSTLEGALTGFCKQRPEATVMDKDTQRVQVWLVISTLPQVPKAKSSTPTSLQHQCNLTPQCPGHSLEPLVPCNLPHGCDSTSAPVSWPYW